MKITEFKIDKVPAFLPNGLKVVQTQDEVVEALENGQTIARYEFGDSMMPMLQSGQFCKIEPINNLEEDIKIGDAVYNRLNGHLNTHMVHMISDFGDKRYFLIGDSWMTHFGWTSEILGKAKGIPYIVKEY